MTEPEVGSEFAGHRIDGIIGRGGMGTVYRATELAVGRTVALKVIASELARDHRFRSRFEHEARVASRISNPHVLPIYQIGEAQGRLYFTSAYVEGADLRSLIGDQGRLEPRLAGRIIAQVASALDAVHAHGVVHRDVKPANVLLGGSSWAPHAYLSDFGLSRATGGPGEEQGTFIGTANYLAPELVGGEATASSDIYALGAVLYEELTGSPPFAGLSDIELVLAHLQAPRPSIAGTDVPAAFDTVLTKAMAIDPADRYLSAGDLGRAAVAAAEGRVVSRAERNVATGEAALRRASPLTEMQATEPRADSMTKPQPTHAPEPMEATAPSSNQPGPILAPSDRPAGIFICYRRDDTRWPARTLAEALRDRFGEHNVFMDVDTVRVGNWRDQINHSLDASAVVVVLIGPKWIKELNRRSGGEDEVRYEIAAAIRRGMLILPVTCGNASLPERAALPDDLAALIDHEAYQLGEDRYWRPTVKILIDDLEAALKFPPAHGPRNPGIEATDRRAP
jgi:serine/threonine protein kinase